MKIINNIKLLVISIIAALALTSCSVEDIKGLLSLNEVSCSGEVETQLVEELNLKAAQNGITVQYLKEAYPNSVMQYALQSVLNPLVAMFDQRTPEEKKKNNNEIEGVKEAEEFSKNAFKDYTFKLEGVRTLAKDDELNKVECSGKAIYELPSIENSWEIDVHYSAQLTDDKKSVVVEMIQDKEQSFPSY